jgi:intracellular sulfur oxidation DsrE/DsrF family protein
MSRHDSGRALARRSFLSKLGIGLATGGVAAGIATPAVQAQTPGAWQPARHDLDAWYDQVPGSHRFVIDTFSPEGFGNALAFINNYYTTNASAYGLKDTDLAVVLVARHQATPFAYDDAIWGKYGAAITQRTNYNDPKTKQPPTVNLFNAAGYGGALTNRGTTLDSLLKRGLRLAVCNVSTRAYAGAIAMASGITQDAALAEITAHLPANSHLVPAGIVAVNRAQEHGYSLATMS